jgi:cell division transport system permease protein
MMAWLRLHGMAFAATVSKLARTPFASLLNILVIGVALALPAGAYTLLVNLQGAARGVSSDPELSVFLTLDAKKEDVADIDKRLKAEPLIASVTYKSREAAFAELKASPALGDVLTALNQNPLPDAFIVRLKRNDADALDRLATSAKTWPKVEHVQVDSAWVRRIAAALKVGQLSVLVLAAMLSVALLAVTFNTIRLQILTQRDEIEVSKLLGATDGTIRRPFYYYGALLGLLGGAAAAGMVWGAITVMNAGVADLARTYASSFTLQMLTGDDLGAILLFAASLGWLGAWLSVSRHLREFEPRR